MKKLIASFKTVLLNFIWNLISPKIKTVLEEQTKCSKEYYETLSNNLSEFEGKLTPKKIQEINDPNLHISASGKVQLRKTDFIKDWDLVKNNKKDWSSFHTSLSVFVPRATTEETFRFYSFAQQKGSDSRISASTAYWLHDALPPNNSADVLTEKLFEISGIKAVVITPYEVAVFKTPALTWEDITPKITSILFETLEPKQAEESPAVQ